MAKIYVSNTVGGGGDSIWLLRSRGLKMELVWFLCDGGGGGESSPKARGDNMHVRDEVSVVI